MTDRPDTTSGVYRRHTARNQNKRWCNGSELYYSKFDKDQTFIFVECPAHMIPKL